MAFFCVYFKGLTCYQSLRSACKVCRPTVDTAVIASFVSNRWNGSLARLCASLRSSPGTQSMLIPCSGIAFLNRPQRPGPMPPWRLPELLTLWPSQNIWI